MELTRSSYYRLLVDNLAHSHFGSTHFVSMIKEIKNSTIS